MELPAQLYEKKILPQLDDIQNAGYAKRIRAAAAPLEAALDAARGPKTKLSQLERVRTSRRFWETQLELSLVAVGPSTARKTTRRPGGGRGISQCWSS